MEIRQSCVSRLADLGQHLGVLGYRRTSLRHFPVPPDDHQGVGLYQLYGPASDGAHLYHSVDIGRGRGVLQRQARKAIALHPGLLGNRTCNPDPDFSNVACATC